MATAEQRLVTARLRDYPDDSWTLDRARATGGYDAARRAVTEIGADDLIELALELVPRKVLVEALRVLAADRRHLFDLQHHPRGRPRYETLATIPLAQ